MKFSIVTISFNQIRFLRQCIESVLSQGYPNVQYIIVDPGSTDGSRELIDQYSDRIQKVVYEPDNGPADGLNKGFAHATGDVFYYLNADDLILPGALQVVSEKFKAETQTDVLLGHGYQIDADGRRVRKIFSSHWSPYLYVLGLANAVQQSTFFRRSAFSVTKGFNYENKTCWDGELLVDMVLAGARTKLFNQYLGEFRRYPDSISGSGRLSQMYELDQSRIRKKILGRNPDLREQVAYWFYKPLIYLARPYETLQMAAHWVSRK